MRTTLDIADDVLFAARDLARREKKSLGEVISDLARQALNEGHGPAPTSFALLSQEPLVRNGIHPLPPRGGVVSNALIDRLRDEEGI